MNRKIAFRFFGILYLLFGAIFILNGFSSITGFVIVNELPSGTSSIIGIVFFVLGILIHTLATTQFRGASPNKLELDVLSTTFPNFSEVLSHAPQLHYQPKNPQLSEPAPILVDTNFIRDMQVHKKGFPKDYFEGDYNIWINQKVNSELRRHGFGQKRAVGVGSTRSTLAHLERFNPNKDHNILGEEDYKIEEKRLGLNREDVKYIKDTIYDIWLHDTSKGKRSDTFTREKFRKSAELDYLYYGVLRGEKNPTFILSEDRDVYEVARVLNEDGIAMDNKNKKILRSNIYGLTYGQIFKK